MFFLGIAVAQVSSTENGTIFGNIVYDSTQSGDRHVVVMNSVHMDIMDYIHPASTSETQFRLMWAEFGMWQCMRSWMHDVSCCDARSHFFVCLEFEFFILPFSSEWENKVAVNTDIVALEAYLHHIASITNMRVLTPPAALAGACNFLAANLYARSIFGEDALLNLSVELTPAGAIVGFIRIRSKTQGIALSLGDKVQAKQRLPVVRID